MVQYIVGSKNGKKNLQVKIRIEIVREINDRYLNSHSRPIIEAWQANIDIQIVLDSGKVVDYMTKYITKTEPTSTKAIMYTMKIILTTAIQEGYPMSYVLKKTMGKLSPERTLSQQETCHLVLGIPLATSSHVFVTVHLCNESKELNFEMLLKDSTSSNDGKRNILQPALKLSLMDGYGRRLQPKVWADERLYSRLRTSLRYMPLCKFAAQFDIGKKGKFRNRIIRRRKQNTVVLFYPTYKSDPNASTYPKYCQFALLKFKPWALESDIQPFDGADDPSDEHFVSLWKLYLMSCEEEGHWLPDLLQREIDNHILNRDIMIRDKSDSAIAIDDMQFDVPQSRSEMDDAAFVEIETDVHHSRDDNVDDPDEVNIQWAKGHNWSELANTYEKPLSDYLEEEKQFMSNDRSGLNSSEQSRTVHKESLNEKQRLAHDLFVGAVKAACGESTSDGEKQVGRLQILAGQGGCGKTHVLNAINTTLGSMGIKGGNFATTGIAAVGIGGSTLHSYNRGFGVPVNAKKYTALSRKILKRLQKLHEALRYIIIDEYSMLKQRELHYLDQRLREIFRNNLPFGGLCVLLVGDIGQLPPVNGVVLWANNSSNAEDKLGHLQYGFFDVVTRLTENVRLDLNDRDAVAYSSILKRLHDGKNTRADVDMINNKCSLHRMGQKVWREKGFDACDVMHLFFRNADVDRHNKGMLLDINFHT